LGEELWSALGGATTLAYEAWPTWDDALLVSATQTLAVQVNGKTRGTVEVAADADKETVLAAARALERVSAQLEGKTVVKEIVVPGKIVNLIAR
jgi:leucyl-tRNA synthetase